MVAVVTNQINLVFMLLYILKMMQKNQPLQQNLSSDQVDSLANAGDDRSLMTAPSDSPDSFNENRILYRKELINGIEAFVFSNNPDDELFIV